MSGAVELLPCPFCGGPAQTPFMYDGTPHTSCAADFKDCAGFDVLAPVSFWNRRAPDPAVAALEAEVARLREALGSAKGFIEGNHALTGVCCCGDYVKDHSGYEGHGPVDSGFYAALLTVEEIDRVLNPAPSEKEAG